MTEKNCIHFGVCKFDTKDGMCPFECGYFTEYKERPDLDREKMRKQIHASVSECDGWVVDSIIDFIIEAYNAGNLDKEER